MNAIPPLCIAHFVPPPTNWNHLRSVSGSKLRLNKYSNRWNMIDLPRLRLPQSIEISRMLFGLDGSSAL